MLTLLVLRHARAGPGSPGAGDRERSLDARGRSDAAAVGARLRDRALTPEASLASPALRARATAEAALATCGLDLRPRLDERLYAGEVDSILAAVAEVDGPASPLLLVGHNPTLAELVERLTGRATTLAPGTLVEVELPIEAWAELAAGPVRGRLRGVWEPRSGS